MILLPWNKNRVLYKKNTQKPKKELSGKRSDFFSFLLLVAVVLLWFLRQGLILSSRLASNNPPTQTLDARVIGVHSHPAKK